jgi:hypothetical protein
LATLSVAAVPRCAQAAFDPAELPQLGTKRIVQMSLKELEDCVRKSYAGAPAPSPLAGARCSLDCGQIFNSPTELKAYAIARFYRHNCPALGYSVSGSTCTRP